MSETLTNHRKPPVPADQFEYKNLKQGEFWRHIPAYKDVDEVIDVVHNAGLAKRVARLRPIGVIKG